LKINRSKFSPSMTRDIIYRVIDNSSIELIFDTLSVDEMSNLWARIDVYVSLHRAEGFGLTLTEAMLRNKYVIATGYGGVVNEINTPDFHRIDYTLKSVGPNNEPYPSNSTWADPNIKSAAHSMISMVKKIKRNGKCTNSSYIRRLFSDDKIISKFYIGMNSMQNKFKG